MSTGRVCCRVGVALNSSTGSQPHLEADHYPPAVEWKKASSSPPLDEK